MNARQALIALCLLPCVGGAEEPVAPPAPVASAPSGEAEAKVTAPARAMTLAAGVQLGFPFVFGVSAVGSWWAQDRPRFDVDLTWELSPSLQSYSVAGAWHVLDSPFFVAARLRLVQYQPPWARGPVPLFFGLGPELGGRFRVGPSKKGSIGVSLHASVMPGQATNLRTLIGLSLGFNWAVFER